MPIANLIKGMSILLTAAVLTAFAVNFISPARIALIGQWDASRGVVHAISKSRPIRHEIEIKNIHTAKTAFDEKHALFVDARPQDLYDRGHIQGAISLPVHKFDEVIDSFLSAHPDASSIITYCSGRECEDAHRLAQLLIDFGYESVTVFIDGFQGWHQAGYPTASEGAPLLQPSAGMPESGIF